MPSTSTNFEGINNVDGVLPPDTNGDVGPNNYVQWVNLHYQVFDRTGASLLGPSPGNALWAGFGGLCEFTNQGDPVVRYDRMANRWVFTQFAFGVNRRGVPVAPYDQCFAVSTTGDPTGTYFRYDFQISNTNFPDYPKVAVWPDAYYMTVNYFSGITFVGGGTLAFDRAKMLNGQAATAIGFGPLGAAYGGSLPSDLDGSILPPSGSPNYFGAIDTNVSPSGSTFQIWKFHVDFATPANSTFGTTTSHTPNFNLPVATYFWNMCNSLRSCVQQPGTSQGLDPISDRLMNRLQYRHFADGHESLVANHTVGVGSGNNQAAVRWYEIRNLSSTPTIYQQSTYAPSSDSRWMGSIAMDQSGDIALGYSVSSSNVSPSIRYAGRLASDSLGSLPQGEATLIAGSGSQTSSFNRWGDYSMMAVDPTDDCTFWYTQEYYAVTSTAGWQTRIGSFKFPGCGIATAPTGLVATATSTTSISLAWTASNTANSYKVERSPDNATWAQIGTSASTSYSDAGLTDGTKYYYRIRASNTAGDSAPSNVASAFTDLKYSQAPQGSWLGNYGTDGYDLLAWNGGSDLAALPQSQLVVDQGTRYNGWTGGLGTSDVRALQSPDGSTRRATCIYDPNQVRMHLVFSSAYSGVLHLYQVDWDSTSRRQSVTVDDGSGPRTAYLNSLFDQGAWVNAPITVASGGSVTVTIKRTGANNVVLSGLFLGPAGLAYSQAPQGSWLGNYGTDGYDLLAWNGGSDLAALPQSQLVVDQGTRYNGWTGGLGTSDVRALQSPDGSNRRATCIYDPDQVRLHLTFSSAYSGVLHLYQVDWDSTSRRQSVTVDDGSGPRTAYLNSAFDQGAWVNAPITVASGGSVTVTIKRSATNNVVLSGLFLGPAGLAYSQAPQGSWLGNYGTDGYDLLAWNGGSDLTALPPSQLVVDQGTRYNGWTGGAGSSDVRALQSPDGSTRRATCIYDPDQVRLHLTFSSAYSGVLHLYQVDWDSTVRRQSVTVDDGSGPRTAYLNSAFDQGAWVNAPITVASGGSVTVTIKRSATNNVVLSGLFLN